MTIIDDLPKHPQLLLIVDDSDEVRAALRRFFSLYFVEVLTAATPAQAEAQLAERRPTLLLCDYYLGARYPTAATLIPRWRETYPFLSRIAIMTGTPGEIIDTGPGAQVVFDKPPNLQRVMKFLTDAHEPPP